MTESNGNAASEGTNVSPCSLPEDLRILRWHLQSAITELNHYEDYNDSGRRYIVESVDRCISDAFKRLNYFKANNKISGDCHEKELK